jgi:hypothetical protein
VHILLEVELPQLSLRRQQRMEDTFRTFLYTTGKRNNTEMSLTAHTKLPAQKTPLKEKI